MDSNGEKTYETTGAVWDAGTRPDMDHEQYDPQELRSVFFTLNKAGKLIRIGVGISVFVAAASILLGAAAILLPGVLSDLGVLGGIGAIDYIIFGLFCLGKSIVISKHNRACVVAAMTALAAGAAAGVIYGVPPAVYLMKSASFVGLVFGIAGSFKYHRLKSSYRAASDFEIMEIIRSNKPKQMALYRLFVVAAGCIGIGAGVYGVAETTVPGNDFGEWTYLSAFIPAPDFSAAHPRIDSLDYLYEPIQIETVGSTEVRAGRTDFTLEHVAVYVISGRVVGTENYSGRRFEDRISPRDAALAWGWLSDTEVDSKIQWGPYSYRGFHFSISDIRWLDSVGGISAVRRNVSNNHLIPDSSKTRRLINDMEIGDYVRIEGYLVNVTADSGRSHFYWDTDTARDNNDCEIVYVTNVTWLHGP